MVLSLQGRSHRFKSCSAHKSFSEIYPTKIQKTAQKPHNLSAFEKIIWFNLLMSSTKKLGKIFSEYIEKEELLISSGKEYYQVNNRYETNGDEYLLTNKAIYSTQGYKLRIDNINIKLQGSYRRPGNKASLKKSKGKYILGIDFPEGNIEILNDKQDKCGGWKYIISNKKFIDTVIINVKKSSWKSLFEDE